MIAKSSTGLRPATAGARTTRADPKKNAIEEKENMGVGAGAGVKPEKSMSRLTRPRTAGQILQSKSGCSSSATDANNITAAKPADKKIASKKPVDTPATATPAIVNTDSHLNMEEAAAEPEHPLAAELKQSEVNYEEVLNTKISTKGTSYQDQKKRMEDQKSLILKLREAVSDLLKRREAIVARAVHIEEEGSQTQQTLNARMAQVVEELEVARGEMAARQSEVENLQQIYTELDALHKLVLERNLQLEAQLAETEQRRGEEKEGRETAEKEASAKAAELEEVRREGEERAREASSLLKEQQREASELRAQLGQEMVQSHEMKSKYNSVSQQFADLKTKFAVLEEMCHAAKKDVERLHGERDNVHLQVGRLEEERKAATRNLEEMQGRVDAREAQHAEAIKSMISGQAVQDKRIRECERERDAAVEEAKEARDDASKACAELRKAKEEAQGLGIEARLAETELERTCKSLTLKANEAESLRAQLEEITKAKSQVVERLAVVEAEFGVFKTQAKLPNVEQIQQLCSLQAEALSLQHSVQASSSQLEAERTCASQLKTEVEELRAKLDAAEGDRRRLHNEVQALKGNIRIYCRVRPASRNEAAERPEGGEGPVMLDEPESTVRLDRGEGVEASEFKFDRVFGEGANQGDVFSEVKDLVQSALDGYNVSLLAYGQTGAGKTHTMVGAGGEHRGVIPRSIEVLLEQMEAGEQGRGQGGWKYTLSASCLEIYNETIRDLLVPPNVTAGRNYTIQQSKHGTMQVSELETFEVHSFADVSGLMAQAERHRTVKGTDMNERSSRSHTVFHINITGTRQLHHGPRQTLHGSLSLVDLAGSERLARSNASGERLKETQSINKSLSALGDVFTALSSKQKHVPYRNSKLTFLLQPCLSGNGKALVVMAVSPSVQSGQETLCTLRFSSLISQCELGKPTKNIQGESSQLNSSTSSLSICDRSVEQGSKSGGSSLPLHSSLPSTKRPTTAPSSSLSDTKKRRTGT